MNPYLLTMVSALFAGIGLYTVLYRRQKRLSRVCHCGSDRTCDPERFGMIFPMMKTDSGTNPKFDGEKLLCLTFARCQTLDTIHLVKDEQKYLNWVTRKWKHLLEPKAFESDIEVLLAAEEVIRVVQLLEMIMLPDGQSAATILSAETKLVLSENQARLKFLLDRRQRGRKKPLAVAKPLLKSFLEGSSAPRTS